MKDTSRKTMLTISILLEAFQATQTDGKDCATHMNKAKGMIEAAEIMGINPLPCLPELEKILLS